MTIPQITSDRNKLFSLYNRVFGIAPSLIVPLAGGGSSRRYYRLTAQDDSTVIGVASDERRDNRAFIELDRVFRNHQVPVPEIYGEDLEEGVYLQQDLGSTDLLSFLHGDNGEELLKETIAELVRLQSIPVSEWEKKVEYRPFSKRQVMWDLNYFKYEFVKLSNIEYDENALEDDFEALGESLTSLAAGCEGLMYRDCQSRNVMIYEGKPYWIDFQGARRGPVVYDIVSLLWQAKAAIPHALKEKMFAFYADECEKRNLTTRSALQAAYLPFVLFRTLQVLGAYGFRGLVEGKAHFIQSLPGAIENLATLINAGVVDSYPELKSVSLLLINKYRDKQLNKIEERDGNDEESHTLTVTVMSFSYKKGCPEDPSGNGGGFMFDCRWMANPGRYAEYKAYTGLDECVIKFLRDHKECDEFINKAYGITIDAVRRYAERGFTSLQIGFGCTGGQHRSVYCAEGLALKLAEACPDVRIRLIHREQKMDRYF